MFFSSNAPQAAVKTGPVKICFILPSLAAGGAERVMITLMNGLDRKRFAPQLIVIDGSGPYRSLIPPDTNFTDIRKPKIICAVPKLISLLRKDRPDIIVSTMAHMNFLILALRPFLPRGTKIIVREAITPGYILDGSSPIKRFVAKFLWRFLYPTADLVLSPTRLVYEEFEKRLGMNINKKTVLPNPVDVDGLRTKAAEGKNLLPASPSLNLLCVGRLHHQKGLDLLLQGLIENPPKTAWNLIIVGEGPERSSLEKMTEHPALSDHVEFTGLQKNPWAYMAGADYLLLPSRWEGLPNVVLEALAIGTRIIALSNAGGIAEIANYTKQDDLYVARDMADFMNALSEATANESGQKLHATRLPEVFHKHHIISAFSELCETLE